MSQFRELFSYRHPPLEKRSRHALEPASPMDPQHVSLDGDLRGQFAVVHSPQETAEYASHMPAVQIEAAEGTAWWSEASRRQLRQVVISDSDLHVSDRALIVLPVRPILTIEQLNVRGIAESVDDVGRHACLRMKPCEWEPPVKKDGGKRFTRIPGLSAMYGEFP